MAGERLVSVLPALADPLAAVSAMTERLDPVGVEPVALGGGVGRVLAEPAVAERDSPAADVSAMDGYAVRAEAVGSAIDQAGEAVLPVAFEVETGHEPPALPEGVAARVFTGGVVPRGADAVVRREFVREGGDEVGFAADALADLKPGLNIRRRGENAAAGQTLLEPGVRITPAAVATLAANGRGVVSVFRKVRVGVAVSGNEVVATGRAGVDVAAVRDANGPSLRALIEATGWAECVEVVPLPDDLEATRRGLEDLAARCDALVTTGGVSMGDHDVLPDAIAALGAEVVYHHLAMRPGKPNLGAVLPGGVAVVALPGNPVSVLVGAAVLAGPVLRRRAGFAAEPSRVRLAVHAGPVLARPMKFRQYVPAALTEAGGLRPF